MNLTKYRMEFPITLKQCYLNHATLAPLPLRVVQSMQQWLDDRAANGSLSFPMWVEQAKSTRLKMARLINAEPEEIAFVKNTSEGIILAAESIPWQQGDNVVTVMGEFPANVYPWLNLARLDVETRFVHPFNGRILIEDILKQIDFRTKLLSISFVEFNTGFCNDLQTLGEICAARGIYFFVDAAQGLGALDLDVKKNKVSFLSANSGKWLLGPGGIGVFYCDREILPQLIPTNISWKSVHNGGNHLSYDLNLLPSAARFEEGSLNMPGIYGFSAALDLLLEIGMDNVEKKILNLTGYLINQLQARDYQILSSIEPSERSGIVVFESSKRSARELHKKLEHANVITSIMGEAIRVSPHFYNTEDEIDRLIECLP
ncbi:MAG: aminotransferase class V-fold PLP-dependent enzyme [Nitrospirae bacterium]|nr:aminotransferase class V-fold PLP-dependent enzyme [Nitrospirota bacterium]MCL5977236.1 aminotransferase class V-fold PLP-dependent enzyme [Nitrospirota bacterium]